MDWVWGGMARIEEQVCMADAEVVGAEGRSRIAEAGHVVGMAETAGVVDTAELEDAAAAVLAIHTAAALGHIPTAAEEVDKPAPGSHPELGE